MKIQKRLFPFLLVFAVLLTAIGLISANISFSKPLNASKVFAVKVDNINANNIDVVGYDNTNITYTIKINEYMDEYIIYFDVINEGDYDISLSRIDGLELPDELNSIITINKNINEKVLSNHADSAYISYKLKNNLTSEEKRILNKYKELKVSLLLNYNQA